MSDVNANIRAAIAGAPAAPGPFIPPAPHRSFWQRLASLNTHFVANTGLLTGALAIATHVAAKIVDAHVGDHAASRIVLDTLDTYAAAPTLAGGLGAAYIGRPKTVAASSATPPSVAPIAELLHAMLQGVQMQPDFIAKAEAAALDKVIALAEDPANEAAALDFISKELAAGEHFVTPLADSVVDGLAAKNALVRMFSGQAKAEVLVLEADLVTMAGSQEKFIYGKVLAELVAMRAKVAA